MAPYLSCFYFFSTNPEPTIGFGESGIPGRWLWLPSTKQTYGRLVHWHNVQCLQDPLDTFFDFPLTTKKMIGFKDGIVLIFSLSLTFSPQVDRPDVGNDFIADDIQYIKQVDGWIAVRNNQFQYFPEGKLGR